MKVRRKPGASNTAVAFGCLTLIVALIALSMLGAWVVMVVWGALALTFGFRTIGFGTAVLVCIALSIVGGYFKNVR